jgi:uncharacterized iron-regulated membrane protein
MTARRMLFWLHLLVGIVVGSVVVFLATTGCILAFQHQIIDWSERGIGSNTSVSTPCLLPSQILAQAATAQHGAPISWVSYADRRRPTEIEFPKGQLLLVDSCSGRLASLLGKEREDTKVVQELMRHTSAKITMDVYQHGDEDAKRLALTHVAALFRDASTAIRGL